MLYAIQEGDDGPVKLGTTLDIFSRLGQLQTSHYKELRLRALWAGDRADEKALHSRFAHLHLRLEWFAWTPELDAYIRERAATTPRALRQLGAAADSRRRRKTRAAVKRPVRCRRLAPAPLAADGLEHPTWNDHAMLDGDAACSAEDWIAVLCDIAPSLTTEHLLTYIELLGAADQRGRLRVDLATLAQRVLHEPDPADAARLLGDLHDRVLPEAGGAYRELPSARLMSFVVVCTTSPARLDTDFLEALVTAGAAKVGLIRYGAGFGSRAVPASFPCGYHIAVRAAWARAQLDAAAGRLVARQA